MCASKDKGVGNLIALALVSLLLVACASAATRSAATDKPLEIKLGPSAKKARVALDDHSLDISLQGIVDSRCPKDVQCVWAGELAARLKIEQVGANEPGREVTLGTVSAPSTELMGVRLDLVDINESSVSFTITPTGKP